MLNPPAPTTASQASAAGCLRLEVVKEVELPVFEAHEVLMEVPLQLIEESYVEIPKVERLEVPNGGFTRRFFFGGGVVFRKAKSSYYIIG